MLPVQIQARRGFHGADRGSKRLVQGWKKFSDLVIPWSTSTSPELAHVGCTPKDAKAAGVAIDTYTQPLANVDRAILDSEDEGFVCIHVRKGTDKIVGATIVAAHAGDMIGELSLAMTRGTGLGGIASAIHPYPTQSEAIRKVGDLYSRTRLTPFLKRRFGKWLAWQRG